MDFPPELRSFATGITALVLVIFLTVVLKIQARKGDEKKRFPPVVGTIFHQLINVGRVHDYHTELSRRYKTFRLLAPIRNQIYTTDPENIEYILRTNFKNYGKGELTYVNCKELFGDGIFAVDGDKWRHQRKIASYEFTTKVLSDFSCAVFKSNASKLAHLIYEQSSSNKTMDIQALFMRSTMDSIFKVGFGVELNRLEGPEEGSRFSRALDNSSEFIARRYFNPLWKVMRFLNIGSEAKLRQEIKVVDDFVYKLIHTKMELMSSDKNNDSLKKEDILSRFLLEREKDPENITDKYLRDIILNFLIAGKDTTAGTLAWFIYMLCKHPSVQDKVAQEVEEATRTGENPSISDYAKSITDEALDRMQYLHATITETLRLFPSVPLDSKVCFADDTLPDGSIVREGDIVFYMPYPMGRMEYIWGDNARIFCPERWLDENGAFRPESPFKFTAFQAGLRICLGKDFAYRQMKIFGAVLLRFFSFKLSDKSKVVNYRTMITLHIDKGLHVHAFHR